MNSFANDKLKSFRLANGLLGLLADCERCHGEEIALGRAEPAILERLRHQSIVTSSEASCAIEGILLAPGRREALLEGGDAPRDRDEWEVENYRRALDFIYRANPEELSMTPELMRRLHAMVKAGEADAGEYKTRDNVILEVSQSRQRVRFRPLEHRKVPDAIEQLCLSYTEAVQKREVPALVAIAALTLDVTAIHPFRDGNGRVSRLITAAALVDQGYELPKLISLEEIVQERSENYYRALERSSEGWHTGLHDLEPFFRFQLQTILGAYAELELRRECVEDRVGVVFSTSLPPKVTESAATAFAQIYPNATFVTQELRVGKAVEIEGHRADLPEAEWEKGRRALKLIESLIARARRNGGLNN